MDSETVVIDLTLSDQKAHTRLIHTFTRCETQADIISRFEDIGLIVSILLTECIPKANLLIVLAEYHRTNLGPLRVYFILDQIVVFEGYKRCDIIGFSKNQDIACTIDPFNRPLQGPIIS